ncbi:cell fate determining protein mab21-related [Holotrichia oblita]|uniref:Cell fate determining protein mab21-related n=1 Tax=Holotrichia oblita TaxID=644536 RepID=A0ACB9TY18_HOLOL|nr:cell fate determining protein mab21-related [Holotrichia oblita]
MGGANSPDALLIKPVTHTRTFLYYLFLQLFAKLIEEMKGLDELFKKMFKTIYCGGSYYDGLKITDPEEYDYDFLLELPKLTTPCITTSREHPGFVQVCVKNMLRFRKQETKLAIALENRLLDKEGNYLRADKLKRWLESLVDKVLETKFQSFTVDDKPYYFKKTKGGPAITLRILDSIEAPKSIIDIDLVPCLKFKDNHWPQDNNFKLNPSKIDTFFVVPKSPKTQKGENLNTLWRLSFQQQEQEFLSDKQSLKSALKLLKRLRDQRQHHNISSYFIKTIFLWQVYEGGQDQSLWEQSQSVVFMFMLKRYWQHLDKKCIPYFWNINFNLLQYIKPAELENIKNELENAINKIDRNLTSNPFVIASYLIPKEEEDKMKQNVSLGKKSCGCNCSNQFGTVEESLREITEKLDLIDKEQQAIKSLLEKVADQQMSSDDRLFGLGKAVNGIYPRLSLIE